MNDWWVYILRCGDGSFYTGIACDVAARLAKHRAGKGEASTRSHLPLRLIYKDGPYSRSDALKREAAIKRLPKTQKRELVKNAQRR